MSRLRAKLRFIICRLDSSEFLSHGLTLLVPSPRVPLSSYVLMIICSDVTVNDEDATGSIIPRVS